MKRFDVYVLALAFFLVVLFFRLVSLFSSGSAVWAIQQNNLVSVITTLLFVLSFLGIFRSFTKLILVFTEDDEKYAKRNLIQVGKTAIGLMILYTALVFIASSGVFIQYPQ